MDPAASQALLGEQEALAGLGPVIDAISASMRQLAEETPESRSRALRADSATIIETSIATCVIWKKR